MDGATPSDTDVESHRVLVDSWRQLTVAERVALIRKLNDDVTQLALAGIRSVTTDLTDAEVTRELAARRFGRELADRAYADLTAAARF